MVQERLVVAITSVNGSTAACAEHGDSAFVQTVEAYFALAERLARATGGHIVKTLGDGMLITFPVRRARGAVRMLRRLQADGTALWQRLDARCRVVVKAGAGTVIVGRFGPPGARRPDIYGDVLNRLFKLPMQDFTLTPELRALVGHD